MTRGGITALILLSVVLRMTGQEEKSVEFDLSGYLKDLQSLALLQDQPAVWDNLLHNRLNGELSWAKYWSLNASLRTRLFIGDQVRLAPDFDDQVDRASNDFLDLSLNVFKGGNTFLHTYFDRLHLDYTYDDLEIRFGRQRINWGINLLWNPNDIFNAYAFTDFDYEERPGSDALLVRYYTGITSSIEVAVKGAERLDEVVAGFLWKFNKSNYDFQFLGGMFQQDLVLGGGWAGNLGLAGFKGEASLFIPYKGTESTGFSSTISVDYVFKNGIYWGIGVLYNAEGSTQAKLTELYTFELSARNLYPYRWSFFTFNTHTFSPISNGSLAIIYSAGAAHALFLNPSFTYSLATNWDLSAVGQFSFNKEDDRYISPVQAFFLRVKFSF